VNVKQFGAVGNGSADDTPKIQAALDSGFSTIDYVEGTYKITSQGTVTYTGASFNYCLKVPSNVTVRGLGTKSITKVADAQDAIAYVNSDYVGSNTRITMSGIYIDGNSGNQTASFKKADGFLFNNVFNLELIDCETFETAGYGFRLDTVQNFKYRGLRATTTAVANRDGCKLIDHRYGVVSDCIFDTGDDSFSVTALNRDVVDITINNIVGTSSLARGFLMNLHGNAEAASQQRTISSVNATGIVTYNCNGPSVLIEWCNLVNCSISSVDTGSSCGLRIWTATANVAGTVSNCDFKVVSKDATEEGVLIKDLALGETAFDNKISAVIENPGDSYHGIRVGYGSRWSIDAVVDYDPASSKASPTTAVAHLGSYSSLKLIVDKGVNNLFMSTGDFNVVSGGVFTNATGGGAAAINILSGADNNTIVGNYCDLKISDAGTGNLISSNGGNTAKGQATFSGTGSATVFNIAHGLPTAPSYAQVTPASAAADGDFSVTTNSTNIVVTYGAAPASGTNNVVVNYIGEI
jgi:hypothetical protein